MFSTSIVQAVRSNWIAKLFSTSRHIICALLKLKFDAIGGATNEFSRDLLLGPDDLPEIVKGYMIDGQRYRVDANLFLETSGKI